MSDFSVGYASVNINPMLGIGVCGYFVPRYASGFYDDLEASCLALTCKGETVVLISADLCKIETEFGRLCREMIAEECGIGYEQIFLSATHTHTGPVIEHTNDFPVDDVLIERYAAFLAERLVDLVKLALADRKPGKMGFCIAQAPDRVAYIRRYKMKDGSTWTCPPINDPNILYPIGTLDQRVNVLRFDREGVESVVLVNYGIHADTINSDKISADFPSWMRRTLDKALDGTKCMFFAGAQGDVGSTHIHPEGGDMNDTEISFDNEMKSYGMARFVGRALAGTVLQVYDKVEYVDVDSIGIVHNMVKVAANVPSPDELPLARKYNELHEAGKDSEIPFTAMELTTVVAEAGRMCRLANGPDFFELEVTGVKIGPVALVGLPGEPFTGIGVGIKEAEGWRCILPCAITNGYEGYFPMQDAFDEGGYEARSSVFKAGVAEALIDGGKAVLESLKK